LINRPRKKEVEVEPTLPQLSSNLGAQILEVTSFSDEAVLKRQEFSRARLFDIEAQSVLMQSVRLAGCSLIGAKLPAIQLTDVHWLDCDLRNLTADNGSFSRVLFESCCLTGIQLGDVILKDVTFKDCKVDMANFSYATLHNVRFVDCDLQKSEWDSTKFEKVRMGNCILAGSLFHHCRIVYLDLRSSRLAEINGITALKGALIDPDQLIEIAPLMGKALGLVVRTD
jgi:uncharacterized protein YjbI with pentapeptide repeats